MVYDYLPTTNFFHGSSNDGMPPVAPSVEYKASSPRRLSKSKSLGLLAPIAHILRSSASLLHAYRSDGLTEDERRSAQKVAEQKQIWHLRLKQAVSLDEYNTAAKQLDLLHDNQQWKWEKSSDEYDAELIERKLYELDSARVSCNVVRMLYLVRTALTRDLGGMGNVRLYKHSYVGTKDLIERYIDSTLETIKALTSMSEKTLPPGLDTKDVLEQVLYARQAFGRSALLLSGGATFGMNHIGVLKALFEAKLLPRIISGASAGSIVCSVLCTRTDEEIPEMLDKFPYGDLAVFEEVGREDGLLDHVGRFLTEGSWIDIKHLSRVMQEMLGDMTFQESYNRTRRILNICVSSASIYELPRLLNYITSPNIMIWSAVAASCSVPLLFSAAPLLVKNPITGAHEQWNPSPQKWVDGSVDNDLPMVKLAEMFNVNHFLVSQVNPHVVPFLEKDDQLITAAVQSASATGSSSADWAYTLTNLAKDEAIHRLQIMSDLGIFPNLVTKARSVLSQKYSGDITILPEINYKDFPRMLKNPTSDFMLDACLRGERATWPKLSRIRNHCAVELELDAAVQRLRAKVVFSPSQVDLRRMSTFTSNNGSRVRRVSGSNVQRLSVALNQDGTDDSSDTGYFGAASGQRPPLRTASSQWTLRDRSSLPPLDIPSDRSLSPPLIPTTSAPPSTTSLPRLLNSTTPPSTRKARPNDPVTPTKRLTPRNPPPGLNLLPHINLLSETETDHTPSLFGYGSDFDANLADIDSHTDDSSPETSHACNDADMFPTLGHNLPAASSRSQPGSRPHSRSRKQSTADILSPGPASIFSQPPTPGGASLALNATTPPSSLGGMPVSPGASMKDLRDRTPLISPELSMTQMTRGRGRTMGLSGGGVGGNRDMMMAELQQQSSPERRYKKLFHHAEFREEVIGGGGVGK